MVTPLTTISVVLQVALLVFTSSSLMPSVYPASVSRTVTLVFQAFAVTMTTLQISIYTALLSLPIAVVASLLVLLAAASPVAGVIENRVRSDGATVYSLDHEHGGNRFPSHLGTNLLSSLAVVAFISAGSNYPGISGYKAASDGDAAFNIVLPLAIVVVLAFIRWQQQEVAFPGWLIARSTEESRHGEPESLDEMDDPSAGIVGYSMADVNQILNVIYLISVTFLLGSTATFIAGFTIERAKSGDPLPLTWQIVVVIVAFLGFLLTCGLSPLLREREAVYMNFLMGVPVGLAVTVLWLSWLESTPSRDITALSVVIVGHVIYSVAVLRSVRERKQGVPLHYFSTSVISFILVLLVAATYMS